LIDVSDVLTASIRAIALMIEAVSTSEKSVIFTRLHGEIFQKAVIFILAVVRS
jgi:hypothetical protein